MKPGFKKTEVGVIPEDWEVVRACEIGNFRGGNGFPLRAQGNNIGDYPFYKVSDMNNEGNETFMSTSNNWISEQARTELGATAFPKDAIVFAKVGAAIFLERKKILTQPSCIDNNMAAFVPRKDLVNYRFLHTQFLNIRFGAYVAATALPALSGNLIDQMPLLLPPLAEQEAIASALGDADALIELLERLIAKKRDVKQGAMQELLTGKRRLPGFTGKWELHQLGEIAAFFKGRGLSKSALDPFGETPCIHYGELFTQYPETIQSTISRTNSSEPSFRSMGNDVLMPTSDVTPRGLAKASCVTFDGVILGGDILVIRPDSTLVFGPFLSFVIRREASQVLQLVTGTTVFHLYPADMKKFTFGVPPLAEQKAIVALLSDLGAEVEALEAKLAKARAIKQGMMQELLTGRIRLK